jgi:hypothetical protein
MGEGKYARQDGGNMSFWQRARCVWHWPRWYSPPSIKWNFKTYQYTEFVVKTLNYIFWMQCNKEGKIIQPINTEFINFSPCIFYYCIKSNTNKCTIYIYEETLSHYIISYCPTCFDVYTSSSGAFSTMVFTGLLCSTVDFEQTSVYSVLTRVGCTSF